jgi:putative flippase GtrA
MGLKNIDKTAEQKGSGVLTLWQFVKFIFVSLLACLVQFALVNLIPLIPQIHEMYGTAVNWFVFNYPVNRNEAGAIISGGLGYFIAFNTSNVAAQIVAFFVNKEKTFHSGSNIAVTLPIYIVFTIALICFSAWLSPTLNTVFTLKWNWSDALSRNAATMACAALQFFIYFPVDKILFHKKKEEK